jgi:uncharacterized SAM-dependent methyltransferase
LVSGCRGGGVRGGGRGLTLRVGTGNFSRDDAAAFLRGFAKVMNDSDTLMIGVDGCQDGTNV